MLSVVCIGVTLEKLKRFIFSIFWLIELRKNLISVFFIDFIFRINLFKLIQNL